MYPNVSMAPQKYIICTCADRKCSPLTTTDATNKLTTTWHNRTNLPLVSVTFENIKFDSLVDTGSMIPLLNEMIYNKIATPNFSKHSIEAYGCNGGELDILGVVTGSLKFHKHDSPINAQFYILKDSIQTSIIPHSWLRSLKAILDYSTSTLFYEMPGANILLAVDGTLLPLPGNTEADEDVPIVDNNQSTTVRCNAKTDLTVNAHKSKTFTIPLQSNPPPFIQLENNQGFGIIKPNRRGTKLLLTIHNTTNRPVKTSWPHTLHAPKAPKRRTIPAQITSWSITTKGGHTVSPEVQATKEILSKHQSEFDHNTKSLTNLPISNKKIDFFIPDNIQPHPFSEETDPLTILYVYLMHIIGSNLHYTLKSEEELMQLILQTKQRYMISLLRKIQSLHNSAKIHTMYQKIPMQIVLKIHQCFLKYQSKHKQQKQLLSTRHYARVTVSLTRDMNAEIKSLTALYFLNQKFINDFFSQTLRHPYFHKLELPLNLQETLNKLIQDNNTANVIHSQSPKRCATQSELHKALYETTPNQQPSDLNFNQFKEKIHQECTKYTNNYEATMQSCSPPVPRPTSAAGFTEDNLHAYIDYSKSKRRLADFVKDQLPINNTEDNRSIEQILQDIPIPKWIFYESEQQILKDYIPDCMTDYFYEFYTYFTDPVFIKFSSEFPLPQPPTDYHINTDPPDKLHLPNGLVDPKTLASIACQFIAHDHPILQPQFKLELVKLAAILCLNGQFSLSLHSMDTGWFLQAFQVKTLLADNAPTSSFPSKAVSDLWSEDLDERIEFLKKQDKVCEILGSPYQAQLSSVPKAYKTGGQCIHNSKTDPILKYIASLPPKTSRDLAQQSKEISEEQKKLINLLEHETSEKQNKQTIEQPQDRYKTDNDNRECGVWNVNFKAKPFLEQDIAQVQIVDVKTDLVDFQSQTPPTPMEMNLFFENKAKSSRHSRKAVKFGKAYIILTLDSPLLRELRIRVPYSKYYTEYYRTPVDFYNHQIKVANQMLGAKSKHLLSESQVDPQQAAEIVAAKQPISYISHHFPNIGQLARNKLKLDIANHQTYLANASNIHFAINQFSSQTPFNKCNDDNDEDYRVMSDLATDPKYLIQTHNVNFTNLAQNDWIQFCFNASLSGIHTQRKRNEMKILGNVILQSQGTQNFAQFISALNTSMRKIDFKRALRTGHSIKKNTVEILENISKTHINTWDVVTLQQVLNEYDHWDTFIERVSTHYQIPIISLLVSVFHSKTLHQEVLIDQILVTNHHLFNEKKPAFAAISYNPTSAEFYRVRSDTKNMAKVLLAVQQKLIPSKASYENIVSFFKGTFPTVTESSPYQGNLTPTPPEQPVNINPADHPKPRYTKVHYPHLNKSFYQKNAVSRIILNSRDTNKLTRPANNVMQSQSDVMNNLGSSDLYSNYDLTAAYDSLPACPISSLINTAAYRLKEYCFLIASQGGANSVLFCQRAVTSLLHRINDQMLLRECYEPNAVSHLYPELQQKHRDCNEIQSTNSLSIDQSWSGRPLLHLPGPVLVKKLQSHIVNAPRNPSKNHYLPMDPANRQKLLMQNTHDQLISNSALVDDLVCSSKAPNSIEYANLNETGRLKFHINVHIFVLEALFQAINTLSEKPGQGPKFKAGLKLKLEKSQLATNCLRYLNIIYLKGYKIICLENFKKSFKYIDALPATGDDLRSAIGFFNFLLTFCKNLRFHMKCIEDFAAKHPAKKSVDWENNPEIKSKYETLIKVVKASNCLHTLPADWTQIAKLIFNSDSCSNSLAYVIGFTLKPMPNQPSQNSPIRPYKFHSARLPTYCLNQTILLKETISAVVCLSSETALLKMLPSECQKLLILDSKPLFDILTKLLNNGALDQFFVAHPSVPLWLMRLYQLTLSYGIQILLCPTKLHPPADFLTRKDEGITPCESTSGKADCRICPGCSSHCIKSSPHAGCPFSIQGSIDKEPNLLNFNSAQQHNIIADKKEVTFVSRTADVDWSAYTPANLDVILKSSNYKNNLQNIEESNFVNPPQEEMEVQQMLHNAKDNTQAINEAIYALESDLNPTKPLSPTKSINTNTADISTSHTIPTIPTLLQNVSMHSEYFPRKVHTLRHTPHTSVIYFTTQKKNWSKSKNYYTKLLEPTAVSQIDFNQSQIEQITLHGVQYIILCAAVDATDPAPTISSLIPNLHACLAKTTNAKTIIYDYNSITQLYRINKLILIQIISMIALYTSSQHTIYASHPMATFHGEPACHLQASIPVLYNKERVGIARISLEPSLNIQFSIQSYQQRLTSQALQLISQQDNEHKYTIGFMLNRNDIYKLPQLENVDITKTQLLLIKDNRAPQTHLVKCLHKNQLTTSIHLNPDSQLTLKEHIFNQTNNNYSAFQINSQQPILPEFCTHVLYGKNLTKPTLSTQIPVKKLVPFLRYYSIYTIQLKQKHTQAHQNKKPGYTDKMSSCNNTVNNNGSSHFLSQLLDTLQNAIIAQSADPIVKKLYNQVKHAGKEISVKNCTFAIFENVLFGKITHPAPEQNRGYKPVLCESEFVQEILKTHKKLNCSSTKKTILDIKQRYFCQTGITASQSLQEMAEILLPCYKCLLGRAAHVRAPLYTEIQSIGLKSLGLKMCTYICHDVMYLSAPNDQTFKNPYISIILCAACKFVSLLPIPRINSDNLASHILQFCQISGKIPACLITDAASTEVFGEMRALLKDFNLIQVKANQTIMKEVNKPPSDLSINQDPSHSKDLDKDNSGETDLTGTAIDQLSPVHKNMLLQDIQASDPPLYRPIKSHNPVSHKATRLETESSLGSLDNLCKRLQIFLKKFLLETPANSTFQDHIERLLQSFAYLNNFKMAAASTQTIPAKLHLGAIRAENILSLMTNVQSLQNPESHTMKQMQQCLEHAEIFRTAETNAKKYHDELRERQLRNKHKLLDEDSFFNKLRPLTILYVKTELQKVPKFHTFAQFHGPFVHLATNKRSKSIYLYGLVSAEIVKKSYRQIKTAFNPEVFNLPLFSNLGRELQFRIVENYDHLTKEPNPVSVAEYINKILINLHKLFLFLQPILPNPHDTQRIIDLSYINDTEEDVAPDLNVEVKADGKVDENIDTNVNEKPVKLDARGKDEDAATLASTPPYQRSVRFVDDDDTEQIQDALVNVKTPKRKTKSEQNMFQVPEEVPQNYDSTETVNKDIAFDRPKVSPPEPSRNQKYNLRQNRKSTNFDDFVNF